MKKTIIQHKDFILKVHASENNTTIFDSFRVKKPEDMKSILFKIQKSAPLEYAINKRSLNSMIREWRVHNLCYDLHILRDRTKHVDLENNQPWYINLLYLSLSPLYLHFY